MQKLSYLCYLIFLRPDNKFYEMFAHYNNNNLFLFYFMYLCVLFLFLFIFFGFLHFFFNLSHECYRIPTWVCWWSFSHKSYSSVNISYLPDGKLSHEIYMYIFLTCVVRSFFMAFFLYVCCFITIPQSCLFVVVVTFVFYLFKCGFIIANSHITR